MPAVPRCPQFLHEQTVSESDLPADSPEPVDSLSQNFSELPIFEKSSQREPSRLNNNQRAAIELLVLGKNLVAVCQQLKIDRRTLFNWRKDERFRAELERRHEEVWGDTARRIQMLADPCIEVLVEQLNDCYDRSRYRAATAILRMVKLTKQSRAD